MQGSQVSKVDPKARGRRCSDQIRALCSTEQELSVSACCRFQSDSWLYNAVARKCLQEVLVTGQRVCICRQTGLSFCRMTVALASQQSYTSYTTGYHRQHSNTGSTFMTALRSFVVIGTMYVLANQTTAAISVAAPAPVPVVHALQSDAVLCVDGSADGQKRGGSQETYAREEVQTS